MKGIIFQETDVTNLHKQWMKRNAGKYQIVETRALSDDGIALARGDLIEFDDFMDAIDRENRRGGWVKGYKIDNQPKIEKEANEIGRYLHGYEDGSWLIAHGYTITEQDKSERERLIAKRVEFEKDNDIYDAD